MFFPKMDFWCVSASAFVLLTEKQENETGDFLEKRKNRS